MAVEAKVGQPLPRLEKTKHKGTSPWKIARRVFLAAALIAGGKVIVDEVQKVGFNPSAIAQDIGNQIDQEANKLVIQRNTDSGYYDLKAPPGRTASPETGLANISVKDIPAIPENNNSIPKDFIGFPTFTGNIGFDAFINGIPGPNSERINPQALITGYLVAKEKQQDGSYLFAVELPYLDGQQDILKRSDKTSKPELKTTNETNSMSPTQKVKEDVVAGAIIWLKLFPGENPTYYPFTTITSWGEESFKLAGLGEGESHGGTGDKGLVDYANIGDSVRARIDLEVNFNSQDNDVNPPVGNGLKDYVSTYHYADSITNAENQFKQVISGNMQTAKILIADAGKNIPLNEQVEGKRYVFTPSFVVFLPR